MSGRIRAHLRTHVIGYVVLSVALGERVRSEHGRSQDIINGELKTSTSATPR